jgi:signal transduction histidine kinase
MNRLTDIELIEELQKRFSENKRAFEELHQLTLELKNVNRRLEESESMKSHFLSNIRNEIINPFASIIALSKNIAVLKKEQFDKAQNMAKMINTEAFILDFQLSNIFAAAEIEAGINNPQITNVDVGLIVKDVCESFGSFASQRNVSIVLNCKICIDDFSEKKYFKTDAYKIQLIVSNLINNAIIFNKEGEKVIVNTNIENNKFIFSVQDFGVGIDSGNEKIIFDRFTKLNKRIYTLNSGQGLGLSVVKEYVEILGGEINVESEKNIGTTFNLEIPESVTDSTSISVEGNEEIF